MAEAFTDYFATIGQELSDDISNNNDYFKQYVTSGQGEFSFTEITHQDVSRVINDL